MVTHGMQIPELDFGRPAGQVMGGPNSYPYYQDRLLSVPAWRHFSECDLYADTMNLYN